MLAVALVLGLGGAVRAAPAAPGWARVRQVLLDKPAHTLGEVAAMVRIDERHLVALIDQHDGREAIRAARNQAVALRIAARLPRLPAGSNLRDIARLVADELPHLEDHDLARLKRQHPQILRDLKPRAMKRLAPDVRAHVRELAFQHPTLDDAELAELYAADAGLADVADWSAEEVHYLRRKSRVVPEQRPRLRRFAGMAAERLARLAPGATLADAVRELGQEHPHVDEALLVRLAADEPALARAIRALAPTERPAPARLRTIDRATAVELGFSAPLMARSLASMDSVVTRAFADRVDALEQTLGDDDGVLQPRHADRTRDRQLALVIAAIHRRAGRKALDLAEVKAHLPEAIAEVARAKGGEFYRQVVTETVEELSASYRTEVLLGGKSPSQFFLHRGMVAAQWQVLRRLVPGRFPEPSEVPLEGDRLKAVAGFYADLLAGRLTTGGFYARAGITAAELRVLQAAHPDLFPRPEGTPVFRTVKGRRNINVSDAEIDALSARWIELVVEGGMSVVDFEKTTGLTKKRLALLREAHPDKFPDRPKRDDAALAALLGEQATALYEADVLVTIGDLLTRLRRDPQVKRSIGALPVSRYWELHKLDPGAFPDLKDRQAVVARLRGEVEEILAAEPGLQPMALTSRMQQRHPRFKRARIFQLGLELGERPVAAARPEPTGSRGIYDLRRSSLPIARLYSLLIRMAPPGTGGDEVVRMLNRLLVKRGLPPYDKEKPPANLVKRIQGVEGTLEERGARVTAEVVAEYARAAPLGTSEADILAAVRADYPSLDPFKLSTFRRLWQESPKTYPALAPFFRRGGLALIGRGERLGARRYRGGWDLDRALLAPARRDATLAAELAHDSEYARIPAGLPLLDEMIAGLGDKKPLRIANVLMVSHLLGSSAALARALGSAGATVKRTIIVGTPYGTNEAVRQTLLDDGFDVRVPPLSMAAYRRAVEKAVEDIVAEHRRNHKPIVVLDDGGLVAEILHENPRYADVRRAFKIVEQTTRGITAAEGYKLGVPIVNVAESETKKAEAALIGRAVARKLVQGLDRLGRRAKGARVTVVGFGNVGSAISREMAGLEAQVTVVETSAERAQAAREAGFDVVALEDVLETTDILVGATGKTSVGIEHMRKMRSGAILVSASSKRLELDMEALEQAASRRTLVPAASPLVRLPTARYRLGKKELTVLGDGWPVNFDGDVEDIDAEEIQITRAAMFAGAIQAAGIHINHAKSRGVIPLDPKMDAWILSRFRELQKDRGAPGIHDPERWPDVLREIAREAGGG